MREPFPGVFIPDLMDRKKEALDKIEALNDIEKLKEIISRIVVKSTSFGMGKFTVGGISADSKNRPITAEEFADAVLNECMGHERYQLRP